MITKLCKEVVEKLVKDCGTKVAIFMPIDGITHITSSRNMYYGHANDINISASKWLVKCSDKDVIEERSVPSSSDNVVTLTGYNRDYEKVFLLDSKKLKELKSLLDDANKQNTHYYKGRFIYHNNVVKPCSRYNILRTYYVREKLNGEIGIDIVRLSVNIVAQNNKFVFEEKYDKFAEIVPGKNVTAYKITKSKGKEEIDFFDAFHITSDNIEADENVYFEGASSMIDFLHTYDEFGKRTGFTELLKHYNCSVGIPENSLFLLYMYLYSEYPVIELLVKMGFYGLIFGMMKKICSCYRRGDIKREVSELSNLLNLTTKGSAALTIPSYVGQFLNAKNASTDEYLAWAALCEYKQISKENFEEFANSEIYWYLNYYNKLREIPNIIKYGYTLKQCCGYIMKQYMKKKEITISNCGRYGGLHNYICDVIMLWKDYLEYCELLEINPDKYPQDIKKAHDDIIVAYRAVENQKTDKELAAIADIYSGYKTTSKYYDVVIPRSVNDFVTEGNNQHNCVGGYANRVLRGNCRIFFIRKIDDKDKSYITAECTKQGLGQLFYRNNTPVTDYTEREYAKAFCNYILSKEWEPKS